MAEAREKWRRETVFCTDCGAEIRAAAEVCPECGIRQRGSVTAGDSLTDQYSMLVWIISLVVGILSLPLGLAIPAYFYYKASNGEGAEQGGLEVATVILLGIVGMFAVEIGGEKGAKVLWGIVAALTALFVVALIMIV